jgi:hypothetical protein
MLSSLTSYLWGGEEPTATGLETDTPPDTPLDSVSTVSTAEEDWVLVGPTPGQLNLGSLTNPRESRQSEDLETISNVDEASSENGSIEEQERSTNSGSGQSRVPATFTQSVGTPLVKLMKTAQLTRQRTSGKAMSSKSLNRSNKTVMATNRNRKGAARQNFQVKMAGANKNLKQC